MKTQVPQGVRKLINPPSHALGRLRFVRGGPKGSFFDLSRLLCALFAVSVRGADVMWQRTGTAMVLSLVNSRFKKHF